MGSKGKSNSYACGSDSSSTIHSSSFILKLEGNGSFYLIKIVGSIPSSVSNFILLAITVWLLPKFK